MNSAEFRALKDGTKSEIVNGLTNEILDTIKQGGITKISEIKPDVELMVKDLFGDADKRILIENVMDKIDSKLIVAIKD